MVRSDLDFRRMGEELEFEMALTTYAVERKRRRLGECCAAAAAVAEKDG